jgi:hypothetical protein
MMEKIYGKAHYIAIDGLRRQVNVLWRKEFQEVRHLFMSTPARFIGQSVALCSLRWEDTSSAEQVVPMLDKK